ncbi:DUF202 domain-containing protein [Phytohabitans kaempferiae]|uniref:DUF202 domain-containing protein n=1 Tax=Phytohabitans kaempferiae TaxID=1620943 RepID=A0ABV6LY19_9ACTN
MNEGRRDRRGVVRDRGLQAERTTLAWSRTALALAGTCLIAARGLIVHFGAWTVAAGSAGGLVAGMAILAAHRRYRHWARDGERPYRAAVPNAALAVATVGLGLAGLAVAVAALG